MSRESVQAPFGRGPALDISSLPPQSPPPSFWDRVSNWASENKAAVYTIAGVAVVITGAGLVYYLTDTGRSSSTEIADGKRKASKKERRKAKKEKEKEVTENDPVLREQPVDTGTATHCKTPQDAADQVELRCKQETAYGGS